MCFLKSYFFHKNVDTLSWDLHYCSKCVILSILSISGKKNNSTLPKCHLRPFCIHMTTCSMRNELYIIKAVLLLLNYFYFSAACPDGCSSFQDSCYKICSNKKTNADAREACTQEGSHLVDIATQEEQDYLVGILSAVDSDDVWLGLTGSALNAPLYWTDGSPLNFTAWDKWGRNQGEICVRMTKLFTYKWGDKGCSYSNGYVCEFECKSSHVQL